MGREARLRLLHHQVEELTPVGSAVSLGCIPWPNLDLVRALLATTRFRPSQHDRAVTGFRWSRCRSARATQRR